MMTVDGIEFEYPLIRRLNNKIRITCETEQNKNSSHIAEGFKSVDITRDRFESCAKRFIFSVLLRCFSIEFCQNFFCLRSEVPSRDLNGDGATDHAESECVIFIHRTPTLQNSSGMI